MFEFSTDVDGFKVNVSFEDKFCNLFSESGEGKTFLFDLMDITLDPSEYLLVDYNVFRGMTPSSLSFHNVICLDHADVYANQEFLNVMLSKCNYLIASIRNANVLSVFVYGVYKLYFDSESLTTKKVGLVGKVSI